MTSALIRFFFCLSFAFQTDFKNMTVTLSDKKRHVTYCTQVSDSGPMGFLLITVFYFEKNFFIDYFIDFKNYIFYFKKILLLLFSNLFFSNFFPTFFSNFFSNLKKLFQTLYVYFLFLFFFLLFKIYFFHCLF